MRAEFDESLVTGNEMIDTQHKELIDKINKLLDSCETYIAEFASGICKDAGYQTIAGQIETFAKLTILALGMPVLTALLETVREFLS